MFLLRRLPARRMELLFSVLMLAGFYTLVWLVQGSDLPELAYWLALLTLELILPLAIALLAAGTLAGDPALDLLLTAHRPAWQVMGERLLLIAALGALLGGAGLLLAQRWGLKLPAQGSDQIFIWLSPMVFCMGLASAFALLRGRMSDGMLAALAVNGGALLTIPLIWRTCLLSSSPNACAWWLLSPLMTVGSSSDAFWPLNRLLGLGIGAVLLAVSLRLAQREEQLLQRPSPE